MPLELVRKFLLILFYANISAQLLSGCTYICKYKHVCAYSKEVVEQSIKNKTKIVWP